MIEQTWETVAKAIGLYPRRKVLVATKEMVEEAKEFLKHYQKEHDYGSVFLCTTIDREPYGDTKYGNLKKAIHMALDYTGNYRHTSFCDAQLEPSIYGPPIGTIPIGKTRAWRVALRLKWLNRLIDGHIDTAIIEWSIHD